jgi:methylmalonyl-CoA carboxyltransferase large subunit
MDTSTAGELVAAIEALRSEVRSLVDRVTELEQHRAGSGVAALPQAAAPAAAAPAAPARAEATEEELLVIAAAVAAFLGVRAQVRQVRLIQSTAWAQVGRATVHASHRVH